MIDIKKKVGIIKTIKEIEKFKYIMIQEINKIVLGLEEIIK